MNTRVAEKLHEFFRSQHKQQFKRGELLLRSGDTPPGIFFLEKGSVRMYSISLNGQELTLNTFKAPSFFPTNWLLNDKVDHYYYEAVVDSTVSIAPKLKFAEFLEQNSDVVFDLLKRIYRGLDGFMLRMEALLSGDAYLRTLVQIILHARRFGEEGSEDQIVALTHQEIASLAGLTRETVTREIKRMHDKGLVRHEKDHILIPNIAKLEQELTAISS